MEISHRDYWPLALSHPVVMVHDLVADYSFLSERTLFHYEAAVSARLTGISQLPWQANDTSGEIPVVPS